MDMLLNLAAISFAFFAFLFMAIALSSGMRPGYMESVNLISVRPRRQTAVKTQQVFLCACFVRC